MAVPLDGQQPANTLMVRVLDQIHELSPTPLRGATTSNPRGE